MAAALVLRGRVLSGSPAREVGRVVRVEGGRIAAVGGAEVLDPRARCLVGEVVLPGFVDAHLHLRALARRRAEVDLSAAARPTTADVLAAIASAARERSAGSWIRAFGFDEALVVERRRPATDALERASASRPLRLLQRTGHLAFLNGAARAALGLDLRTLAEAERDREGCPTGWIQAPGRLLRGRLPAIPGADDRRLVAAASRELLAHGVTTLHEVTPGARAAEIDALAALVEDGTIGPRVRLYAGVDSTPRERSTRTGDGRFRVAGVKLVAEEIEDLGEVARRLAGLDGEGVAVATHAVEEGPLAVVVGALFGIGPERVRRHRHRIEHASLCPPPLALAIAASGAAVVTHPAFLERFAAKYQAEIPVESRSWLYPLRSLAAAGVPIALGSDAPIGPPDLLASVVAAVRREIASDERIGLDEALGATSAVAARLGGDEAALGAIAPGRLADLVLLEGDVARPESLRVRATLVGGEIVFPNGSLG